MSRVTPYDTAPQLIERTVDRIDMMVKDRPDVIAYRFWGAPTLDDAYGDPTGSLVGGAGPEAMFTVGRSLQFRSPSIIQRRWSWYGENLKGMSRVAWDPADYVTNPLTSFPGRDETWFVRLQEQRHSTGPAAATGVVDASASVGAGDTLTIMGVLFQGVLGPGNPILGQWEANGAPGVAGAALIAAINEPTTMQPALLAAAPVGVTVTASAGAGVDEVILTASVTDVTGDLVTIVAGGGNISVSGPTLTGGGETFLVVNGPVDVGDPKLGSIYVVPPAPFFGQPQPGLTLAGTAPAGTGAVAGSVPPFAPDMQVPNPMSIVLPRYTASCFVNNTGVNPLLCSTGWGIPMLSAGTTEDAIEFGGGIKELVLAGFGGATTFDVYAVVALGPGG